VAAPAQLDQRPGAGKCRSRPETINKLAPFYEMLAKAQPYYEGGRPFITASGSSSAIATRYKYPTFRAVDTTELLQEPRQCLSETEPWPWNICSSYMLPERDLSRYPRPGAPRNQRAEAQGTRRVARVHPPPEAGLLVVGDALRHTEQGEPSPDFRWQAKWAFGFSEIGRATGSADRNASVAITLAADSPVRPSLPISVKQA